MAVIDKKLIHFTNLATFEQRLNAGEIKDTSIVFIQDAKRIWTHGQYYSSPYTKEEIDQLFVGSNVTLNGYSKDGVAEIVATDTVNSAFGKVEDYLGSLSDLNAILVDTGDVASDPTINDYISPEELSQALADKQDKNLYINNITASNWVTSTEFEDYKYECDIQYQGVDSSMYAEVVFSIIEATSGDYAPVCDVYDNIIRLYSKVNTQIVIPTIIIMK